MRIPSKGEATGGTEIAMYLFNICTYIEQTAMYFRPQATQAIICVSVPLDKQQFASKHQKVRRKEIQTMVLVRIGG